MPEHDPKPDVHDHDEPVTEAEIDSAAEAAARHQHAQELGIRPGDIHSLTDFQRNARDHIARLRESGRPAVLTVNGRAEVVAMSPEAFEALAAKAAELEGLKSLRKVIDEIDQGVPGIPAENLLEELDRRRAERRRTGRQSA